MRWVLAAAFALAGCPGPGDGSTVDAPVDPQKLGIHLAWATATAIPGAVDNEVTISSARLGLSDVRVIGDAGPGDPRTQLARLVLAWGRGAAPQTYTFVDAPTGLYSRIRFELEADAATPAAYEILGTARINNADVPFRISDTKELDVNVSVKRVMLPPGGDCDLSLTLDFEKVIERVEFEMLPLVDGVRVLDENSPRINDVRKAVRMDLFRKPENDQGS
ncbi:MAG: hypothetical protein KIT31_35875 [Deltaproteobacteria bacterium]|nr:hypothetical protein [Deltaproteobacteria bacterium]